jgi:dynein heavy chain
MVCLTVVLAKSGLGDEAKQQFQQLSTALEEFIRKTFNEWTGQTDRV